MTQRSLVLNGDYCELESLFKSTKTSDEAEQAETQIREYQREVDYQVREYPIEVVVRKYLDNIDQDQNEIFVPDYQRDLVWEESRQSKFIESLLIGLPIPYLFVSDVRSKDEEEAGRLEIVDGTQRIRTLSRFLSNDLTLSGLQKLTILNGFRFEDLTLSRQRRFRRITLRLIELTEKANEETRRDMFERINTGSVPLNPMETRRGSSPGKFIDLVEDFSRDARFEALAPLSVSATKRFDRQELVTRFFAFRERYQDYAADGSGKVVAKFVDDFTELMNKRLAEDHSGTVAGGMRNTWQKMLNFVQAHFPNGFKKSEKARSTPRVRFEAIAVGSSLALEVNPDLVPASIAKWIDSDEFKRLTTSDAANNRTRVIGRIEFVRDRLLDIHA